MVSDLCIEDRGKLGGNGAVSEKSSGHLSTQPNKFMKDHIPHTWSQSPGSPPSLQL